MQKKKKSSSSLNPFNIKGFLLNITGCWPAFAAAGVNYNASEQEGTHTWSEIGALLNIISTEWVSYICVRVFLDVCYLIVVSYRGFVWYCTTLHP
jgi:hypothetical protein